MGNIALLNVRASGFERSRGRTIAESKPCKARLRANAGNQTRLRHSGCTLVSVVHARAVTVTTSLADGLPSSMQRFGQTTPSWFTVVVACPDGLHSFTSFSSYVPVSSPPSACTALHGSNSQIPISPDPVTAERRVQQTHLPSGVQLLLGADSSSVYSTPIVASSC